MRRRELFLVGAAGLLVMSGCAQTQGAASKVSDAVKSVTTPKAPQLHAAMRQLWQGHIVTTRNYALAIHAGDAAAARQAEADVVDNATQIADAVSGFYGQDAGAGTLNLLGGHWAAVKAYTDAAKAQNQAAQDQAMSDMANNAMEIATFFAGANPENWTVDQLNQALLMHGGDHKQQIDAMMSDAPAAQQQELWDHMQEHMDMIADALSDGIARQFPDKVS